LRELTMFTVVDERSRQAATAHGEIAL